MPDNSWLAALLPATGWPAIGVLLCVAPLALALDWWAGPAPLILQPQHWMREALEFCGARLAPAAPLARDWRGFWLGALAWTLLAAASMLVAWGAQRLLLAQHELLAVALLALLLKPLLGWRRLHDEVLAVELALGQSLPAGRERLGELLGRDPAGLGADEDALRTGAIAALADQLCHALVAPLLWFALLGLPGAALYRFANTADALWGHRAMHAGQYWQWAGKWAARAADLLCWLPARLTAWLLTLAGVARKNRARARLAHQARKTPSPNSGWPMAAMALALDVRLSRPGRYTLHRAGRSAGPLDTRRAVRIAGRAVLALVPVLAAIEVLLVLALAWAHR